MTSTATTSPASIVAFPPGRGAEVERPLALARADGKPDELGRGALRPDPSVGKRSLVDPVDVPCAGNVGIGDTLDLAADEPNDRSRRLV